MTQTDGNGQRRCPNCGMTPERFRRIGFLGCAECYRVFRKEISAVTLYVQGKLRHVKETVSVGEKKRALMLQKLVVQELYRQALNEENEAETEKLEAEIDRLDRELDGREDGE